MYIKKMLKTVFSLVRVRGRIAATFSLFSKLFMGNSTWYVSVIDDNTYVVNKKYCYIFLCFR